MKAKTSVLETLHAAARDEAARTGISYAQAFERVLARNPRLYELYTQERDSHAPGSSAAKAYAQRVEALAAEAQARA